MHKTELHLINTRLCVWIADVGDVWVPWIWVEAKKKESFSLNLDRKKFLMLKSHSSWRRRRKSLVIVKLLRDIPFPKSKFSPWKCWRCSLEITRWGSLWSIKRTDWDLEGISMMAEFVAKTLLPANGTKNSCRRSTVTFMNFSSLRFPTTYFPLLLRTTYFFAKIKRNFIRRSTNLQISYFFLLRSLFAPWLKRLNESSRDLQPTKLKSDWSRT